MKIFHERANVKRTVLGPMLGVFAAVVACHGVLEEPSGGGSGPGPAGDPQGNDPNLIGVTKTDPCMTPTQSFAWETYGPIFSRCIGCHNSFGIARQVGVELRLTFPGEPDFTERNVALLTQYAAREVDTADGKLPLLLAKPTGRIGHVGGTVVPPDSPEGKLLQSFVEKLRNPPTCRQVPEDKAQTALSSLQLASPRQTYARAKFALTGELVTPEELDGFPDTEEALDAKLDELIKAEAFFSRVQDMFADWLLTDAYSSLVRGRDLMNQVRDFPRNSFFEPLCTAEILNNCCDAAMETCCASSLDPAYCSAGTNRAIDAVAREPLELVRHVVRNNLPLTELVTADYTILNPYSARVYGFTDVQLAELFDTDPNNDATEFKLARLAPTPNNGLRAGPDGGGYPHSGVLSMPSLMVRYPSSTSNQQRTRGARLVLDRMLAIPVMKLSDFSTASLPANADLELATQEYPACTVCHAAIDPVAGHFRNFGSTGQYRPGSRLPAHLPKPTFLTAAQAEGDMVEPLSWLGEQVATHDRFPIGVLMPVLADLIGAEILTPPTDVLAEGYAAKYLAFRIQQIEIQRLRREFAGPQALRLAPLVKSIIKGSFFRAIGAPEFDQTTRDALSLAGVGPGTLLTPEQLARKIEHVTGLTYRSGLTPAGRDMFRSFQEFRLMFGGTDWDATPQRYREPNVMAVRIAMRTGNEMACLAVPRDFSITAAAERRLFRNVESGTIPESGGEAAIKAQIRRLHRFLLAEDLPDGHPELEATYQLWVNTRTAGLAAIKSRSIQTSLPTRCRATASFEAPAVPYPTETRVVVDQDPQHTVRSWMAVIAYLVSDARFFLQ